MPLLDINRMDRRMHFYETPPDSQPSEDSSDPSGFSSDEIECLTNPSQSSVMVDSLEYIKSYPTKDAEAIDSEVRRFLYATFEVCTSNVELMEEEKRRIGPLIKNAIPDIDDCLKDIGDDFDGDYGPDALVLRSGYQFMVDNFKNFPDGKGSTLENAFKYFEVTQSIETLDERLKRWKKRPYICMEDIHHTAEELDRPAEVPESHDWWFQPFQST